MAVDSVEVRLARLEGAFVQINERLGSLENRFVAEIGAVRGEMGEVRGEIRDLRRQLTTQFYWILTLVLGSIVIPFLRDLTK